MTLNKEQQNLRLLRKRKREIKLIKKKICILKIKNETFVR